MRATRTPFASIPEWVVRHPVVQSNRTVLHVYASMFLDADFGERAGPADWRSIADRTGLGRPTIYRDVKALRDAGILVQVGRDHYLMPLDDPSITVDSLSTTVDSVSTAVDPSSLTELDQSFPRARATARAKESTDPLRGFAEFWSVYPKRNGRRLGRGKCEDRWRRLSIADRRAAWRGAVNYGAEVDADRTIAKDPDRWLRDRCWQDWQERVVVPAKRSGRTDPLAGRHELTLDELLAIADQPTDERRIAP